MTGNLHKRPDHGRECSARVNSENRRRHSDRQFEIVRGGRKGEGRDLFVVRAQLRWGQRDFGNYGRTGVGFTVVDFQGLRKDP